MCKLRCNIGKYGNNTKSAKRKNRKYLIIISGVKLKLSVCQRHHLGDLGKISGCFLDSDNVLYILCKVSCCSRLDVAACTARYIVHDERSFRNCIGNCCVMSDKSLLCSLVIIRCYNKKSVCTIGSCFLGHHDCCLCTIGTCSCDYRHTFVNFVNCELDCLKVLSVCQSRRFSCCSADNDGVCAVRDLILKDLLKFLIIYLTVFVHRCYDCNACSFKNCHLSSSFFLL